MNHKVDYAIISAMPEELAFIIDMMFSKCKYTEIKIFGMSFKIYPFYDKKILIAYSGIGTTFATNMFTLIQICFSPEYCFIAGTAGSIHQNLKLRDVIIAEYAFEAELQDLFSHVKDTPFESCLKHPLKNAYFPSKYAGDPELVKMSDALNISDINIYKGTIVTSNAFPAPKELFEKIKQLNPYAIDMETSAFYQTAWVLNAKVLSIRGISNILNADGTDDKVHESDVKGSSENACLVLSGILHQLPILYPLLNKI